ncbi:MAG: cell division protein FtsZ [Xanthobacteraceae bacterium]
MTINLKVPDIRELKPRITVFGVGGAGGNAVNNMITGGLAGVDFVVANTDAQALTMSKAERIVQMGVQVTEGLGAGSQPDVGRAAAEEVIDEIRDHLSGAHMVFVTAGMGGGTGTGAAPVIARISKELGILTVAVVTKPFQFEGQRRMRFAEQGIQELQKVVDTLLIIPNQNLFRIANEKTTFADAFAMADQVLYSGVACITDLMVKEGLINLDFADVRSVMREMGKAMMGTGEASGERRAQQAAEAAIANPLLDETSMKGARGLLISITGGKDLTLFEVDEAATRIREEVDLDANIILGATFDEALDGVIRVSVVATGIENAVKAEAPAVDSRLAESTQRLRPAQPQPAPRSQPVPSVRRPPPAVPPAVPRPAASDPGVTIAPMRPAAAAYEPETEPEPRDIEPPTQAPFIPPQLETPPRMPRVEDFPLVAQRAIEARQRPIGHEEDRGPMSLLRRLAHVGLGRRDDDDLDPPAPRQQRQSVPPVQAPRPPGPTPQLPPRPAAAERPAQPRAAVPEVSYRPRPGELDQHGRPTPGARLDDDQLEIPAFLRRQAN